MVRPARRGSGRASGARATARATGRGGRRGAPSASAAAAVVAPLGARTYSVSSYYGPRCMPVASASTWHLGQDLGAPSRTRRSAIPGATGRRGGSVRGGSVACSVGRGPPDGGGPGQQRTRPRRSRSGAAP